MKKDCNRKVTLWVDGGTLVTNPGLGYGSYAFDSYKVKSEHGIKMTSNESEYLALIEGLNAIIQEYGNVQDTFVGVKTDSRLVQNQLNFIWKVNSQNLVWLHYIAQLLLGNFAGWRIEWVPRMKIIEVLGH